MKTILSIAIALLILASCDTPNGAIGNPEGATNTSGTTGSANMTNTNNGQPATKTLPGTVGDTTTTKKDSLPK